MSEHDDWKGTWKKLLTICFKETGENWDDIIATTLTEEQLNKKFDDDYGGKLGPIFTTWTAKRVYFPVVYDGRQWVDSVSRNPNGKQTKHIGGES